MCVCVTRCKGVTVLLASMHPRRETERGWKVIRLPFSSLFLYLGPIIKMAAVTTVPHWSGPPFFVRPCNSPFFSFGLSCTLPLPGWANSLCIHIHIYLRGSLYFFSFSGFYKNVNLQTSSRYFYIPSDSFKSLIIKINKFSNCQWNFIFTVPILIYSSII